MFWTPAGSLRVSTCTASASRLSSARSSLKNCSSSTTCGSGLVWKSPSRFRMEAKPVWPTRMFSTRSLKAAKSKVARRIQG